MIFQNKYKYLWLHFKSWHAAWISIGYSFEKLFALHVIFICIFVAKRYQKHHDNPKTRQFTVGDNPLITFFINGAAWEWIRVNIKVVKHETSENYSVKWEKQMKMFISFPGILMRNDIAFFTNNNDPNNDVLKSISGDSNVFIHHRFILLDIFPDLSEPCLCTQYK